MLSAELDRWWLVFPLVLLPAAAPVWEIGCCGGRDAFCSVDDTGCCRGCWLGLEIGAAGGGAAAADATTGAGAAVMAVVVVLAAGAAAGAVRDVPTLSAAA
jgi:hypothetical protein